MAHIHLVHEDARAGLIAPDETTFKYLEGRPYAPKGGAWDLAPGQWRRLPSDKGAVFDSQLDLIAADIPLIADELGRGTDLFENDPE